MIEVNRIRSQGMIAENNQRQVEGLSMAYIEKDFVALAEQMKDIAQQIRIKTNRKNNEYKGTNRLI